MKKYLPTLLALSAIIIISCSKEIVKDDSYNNPQVVTTDTPSDVFPKTLTAVFSDGVTKTAYDTDGHFSWVEGDEVRLIAYAKNSEFTPLTGSTYSATTISSDGKTATFTAGSTDIVDFSSETYESAEIAVYPTSIARPQSGTENNTYYKKPFVTVPNNSDNLVSGLASSIILTGVPMQDNLNYKFSTAMAVIKITVNNIPSKATLFKLSTSDKTQYPIDGDFELKKNADGIVELSPETHLDYNNNPTGKGYLAVDLSSDSYINSRDFYFNIPAATYPSGTLSVVVEDAKGGQIMKRTINKELTLARNDRLDLPELTYSYSITFSGTANAPIINWTIDSKRIRFCVSTNSAIDISEFNSSYTFKRSADTGSYSGYYALSSFSAQKPTTTGQWYMHYLLQSDEGDLPTTLDDSNVISYGTIPFYFLSDSDTSIAASYTATYDSDSQMDGSSMRNNEVRIAISNNPAKGNVMITHFLGRSYDLTDWATGASTSGCTAGSPCYGTVTDSGITFFYSPETPFFTDASDKMYYLAQGEAGSWIGYASHANYDIELTSTETGYSSSTYIYMKWTKDGSSWGRHWAPRNLVLTKNND